MKPNTWEFIGLTLGLIRGLFAVMAILSASAALVLATFARLRQVEPYDRRWRRIRNLLGQAVVFAVVAAIGQIAGASVPDLLGFSPGAIIAVLILTAGMGILTFGLTPQTFSPTSSSAGRSTWAMAARRRRIVLVLIVAAIGLVVLVGVIVENYDVLGIGGTALLALVVALRFVLDFLDSATKKVERTVRRAERGAEAEVKVGNLLDSLGDRFLVLHDVESPHGNIDHLVITQEGKIFVIETKSHRGRISVQNDRLLINGHPMERDPIRQVVQNAIWVKERVQEVTGQKPWVEGIVVFPHAFVPKGTRVRGIYVQNIRYLAQTLREKGQGHPVFWEERTRIKQRLKGE